MSTAARPSPRPLRPDWFYYLVAVFTALHLAWLAVLVFDFALNPLAPDGLSHTVAFRWLLALAVVPGTLIVGVLVLRRTRGNVVGLCLLLLSVSAMSVALADGSPFRPYDVVLNTGWSGLWLLGLFFPDGQPQPGRLGGPIRVLAALSLLGNAATGFLRPMVGLSRTLEVPNPLFIQSLRPLFGLVFVAQAGLLVVVIVVILVSLVWRYRVSDPHGRLQLKWLAWGFGLLIALTLPLILLSFAAGASDPFSNLDQPLVVLITLYIFVFPPVTVGIAILRHRLYDIDVVIRRTLVYSVLTSLLALTYFGAVLVLQNVFRVLTGQEQNSLAAVLSTLAIAALFVPLRSRVQRAIDRRFFRSKYDAARTLLAFGAQARDETDLDALTQKLVLVMHDTLQPQGSFVWLRPAAPAARGED